MADAGVCACAAQVREVLRLTPRQRQTLLFSATMTEEVGVPQRIPLCLTSFPHTLAGLCTQDGCMRGPLACGAGACGGHSTGGLSAVHALRPHR